MAAPQSQQSFGISDMLRIIQILALVAVGYFLCDYAPLIPKVIVFLDDIHVIRSHAPEIAELKKSAAAIQQSLENLQKKFNFFKQEAERRGVVWPPD